MASCGKIYRSKIHDLKETVNESLNIWRIVVEFMYDEKKYCKRRAEILAGVSARFFRVKFNKAWSIC